MIRTMDQGGTQPTVQAGDVPTPTLAQQIRALAQGVTGHCRDPAIVAEWRKVPAAALKAEAAYGIGSGPEVSGTTALVFTQGFLLVGSPNDPYSQVYVDLATGALVLWDFRTAPTDEQLIQVALQSGRLGPDGVSINPADVFARCRKRATVNSHGRDADDGVLWDAFVQAWTPVVGPPFDRRSPEAKPLLDLLAWACDERHRQDGDIWRLLPDHANEGGWVFYAYAQEPDVNGIRARLSRAAPSAPPVRVVSMQSRRAELSAAVRHFGARQRGLS
jgi:hypothetical protein